MHRLLFALTVLVTLAPAQSTPYVQEWFELYAPGTICQTGCANSGAGAFGWDAWDSTSAFAGAIVNTTNHTPGGSNALQVSNNQDAILPLALNDPFGHPQAGAWVISVYVYLDSANFVRGSGIQYFILNNVYNHLGPYSWTGQFAMNPDLRTITDDLRQGSLPLVLDRWVELRCEIDLDNDCMTSFYDGQPLSAGPYVTSGTTSPVLAVANIDLYATAGTSIASYDDLEIRRGTAVGIQQNSLEAAADFDGVQATTCTFAVTERTVGSSTVLGYATNLGPLPWDAIIDFAAPVAPVVTTAGGQFLNVNIASPAAIWFNTLGAAPNLVSFPPTPAISLPLTVGVPLEVTTQMIIIDPTHPDSFKLSQAAGLRVL